MKTRLLVFTLIGALALAPCAVALEQPADAELEEGIRQTQIGEFEKAVVTLDTAARRLAAEGGRSAELARAYVYLSIAYLGLSQEQKAKAQFLEALKADNDMEINEGEFPPRVLEFFEEARQEAEAEGVFPAPAPTAPEPVEAPAPVSDAPTVADTSPTPAEPEKKGGSMKWVLIGGGAAAAAGVALAAGGGGGDSGSSTAPSQPVEQTLEVMSPEGAKLIPDLGQAVSQLTITQGGTIVEATLDFRIRHTCRLDLVLELRHPDGTTYSADAPQDCLELWEGPLAVPAQGKPSNGTWTLTVFDTAVEDEGTLETWGLRLRIRR